MATSNSIPASGAASVAHTRTKTKTAKTTPATVPIDSTGEPGHIDANVKRYREALIERNQTLWGRGSINASRKPDAYGDGCAAGKVAAYEVFTRSGVMGSGGRWQNPALDRIATEDNELRGWLVGYLYTLECLALAEGALI